MAGIGTFALEQAMDELAERLRIDPLVLRERNDAHPARREAVDGHAIEQAHFHGSLRCGMES
ncbi:MAG TPA: molybdopterin-dependent oxidoreductase [Burkholderiaceae bacterium]|nr:molybdopterin-dependent oxidoreductase [Burkholderiaceae bacterium]